MEQKGPDGTDLGSTQVRLRAEALEAPGVAREVASGCEASECPGQHGTGAAEGGGIYKDYNRLPVKQLNPF